MSCAGATGIYKNMSPAKIKVDAASVLEVLRYTEVLHRDTAVSILRGTSNEPMNIRFKLLSCAGAAGIYKSLSKAKIKVDAAGVLEVLRHKDTATHRNTAVSVLRNPEIIKA